MPETSPPIGTPEECDFERRRGDTKDIRIRLLNKDTGQPIDVNGYTAKFTINTEKEPTDESNQVFQAPGTPDTPTTDGILIFDFSLFASVAIGSYFYDMETTDAASQVNTPLTGKFRVKQDITKT